MCRDSSEDKITLRANRHCSVIKSVSAVILMRFKSSRNPSTTSCQFEIPRTSFIFLRCPRFLEAAVGNAFLILEAPFQLVDVFLRAVGRLGLGRPSSPYNRNCIVVRFPCYAYCSTCRLVLSMVASLIELSCIMRFSLVAFLLIFWNFICRSAIP